MASNGTPQSYLSGLRPPNQSDNSMAQDNTSSGNPNGYVPQLPPQTTPGQYPDNRYIPPSYDPATGRWSTQGLQYSLPTAYTPNAGGGLPNGPQVQAPPFMPQFGGQQQAPAQQQQTGVPPGPPTPPNAYPAPSFAGNAQPGAAASPANSNTYAAPQQQSTPQGMPDNSLAHAVNSLATNTYLPKFGNGYATPSTPATVQAPPGTPGGAMPPAPSTQGGASGFFKPNILGAPHGLFPGIPGFGGDSGPQSVQNIIPKLTHTSGFAQRQNDPYANGNAPADNQDYGYIRQFQNMPMPRIR
jgi:hypothetical protein